MSQQFPLVRTKNQAKSDYSCFPCKKEINNITVKSDCMKHTKNLKCNCTHYSTEEQQHKKHNQAQNFSKINTKNNFAFDNIV